MQFDKDLESEYKELFLEVRGFLLAVEEIKETKKNRITTYADSNGGICHLRTMPHGIDIGFLKGAKLEDKYNLLTGKGKTIRVLAQKIFNREVVAYYLEQALAINAKK